MFILSVVSLFCILAIPWLLAGCIFRQTKKTLWVVGCLSFIAFPAYVIELFSFPRFPRLPPEGIYLPGLVADPYFVIFWSGVSFTARLLWQGIRNSRNKRDRTERT